MKRIVLYSLVFSLLYSSLSFAQKPSYKDYIKPTLKGMGALALFWTSYQTGRLTYFSYQSFPDTSHTPTTVGAFEYSLDMVGAVFSLAMGVPSGIACASTGALGCVLAKSAYNDIKKSGQKV